MSISKLARMSLIALAALAGSEIAASAQSVSPGDPGSAAYVPYRTSGAVASRPLTVNRRRVPAPVVIAAPIMPPVVYGPGVIVTAPLHAARAVVALPFNILSGIFPTKGALAASPLVLIGAPIQAAGQIAQFPFRLVDAAFGATDPRFGLIAEGSPIQAQ